MVLGNARWSGGAIAGRIDTADGPAGGVTANAADFQIVNGGTKSLQGLFRNRGNVSQHSNVIIGNDALLINESTGRHDLQQGAITGSPFSRITNAGTFIKTDGDGEVTVDVPFHNANGGSIEVRKGTMTFTEAGEHDGGRIRSPRARRSYFATTRRPSQATSPPAAAAPSGLKAATARGLTPSTQRRRLRSDWEMMMGRRD